MIGREEAANLTDIPNVRQKGTRLGNWLTREQAKELLAVPDRSTLKGKRDYVIMALLVGCALRRRELADARHRGHPATGRTMGHHRSRAAKVDEFEPSRSPSGSSRESTPG